MRVMAMVKASSGRLKFPPLVFFPSRDVAFALALDSTVVPAPRGTDSLPAACGIPSLLHAGVCSCEKF